jgi:hypothetical protein
MTGVPEFRSTTYLTKASKLIGVVSSKKAMLSFWHYCDDDDGGVIFSGGLSTTHRIILEQHATDGKISLILRNSSGTTLYNAKIDTAYDDGLWRQITIAVNLGTPIVTWRVDGAAPTLSTTTAATDGTIAFEECTTWRIGQNYDATGTNYEGSLYDFLFKADQFVDITDEDLMESFVSSDGRTASGSKYWQNVGPDAGKKPVGYGSGAPIFNGEKADICFSNCFQNNQGTGGDFVLTDTFASKTDGPEVYRSAAHYDNKERWYESDLTGWSYTRSQTFIENREGHPKKGLRMGLDERDDRFKEENPGETLSQMLFNDSEDDSEEWDR